MGIISYIIDLVAMGLIIGGLGRLIVPGPNRNASAIVTRNHEPRGRAEGCRRSDLGRRDRRAGCLGRRRRCNGQSDPDISSAQVTGLR